MRVVINRSTLNMKITLIIALVLSLVVGYVYMHQREVETLGGKLTESSIKTEQDASFAKDNAYIQVKDGKVYTKDGLISKEVSALDNLKHVNINVYESPRGKGYQTVTKTSTSTVYQGYGPEAEERTYVIPDPIIVASSTERI